MSSSLSWLLVLRTDLTRLCTAVSVSSNSLATLGLLIALAEKAATTPLEREVVPTAAVSTLFKALEELLLLELEPALVLASGPAAPAAAPPPSWPPTRAAPEEEEELAEVSKPLPAARPALLLPSDTAAAAAAHMPAFRAAALTDPISLRTARMSRAGVACHTAGGRGAPSSCAVGAADDEASEAAKACNDKAGAAEETEDAGGTGIGGTGGAVTEEEEVAENPASSALEPSVVLLLSLLKEDMVDDAASEEPFEEGRAVRGLVSKPLLLVLPATSRESALSEVWLRRCGRLCEALLAVLLLLVLRLLALLSFRRCSASTSV